jgi:hypothetical protein
MVRAISIAVAVLALTLAACSTGLPGSTTPAVPALSCPAPAAGTPTLKVVAKDVTLRDQPLTIDSRTQPHAIVLGILTQGTVVQFLATGNGPWRKVACGATVGWALEDNEKPGDAHRTWLQPAT